MDDGKRLKNIKPDKKRPVGRPKLTEQQRAQREAVLDTHIKLPQSLVVAIQAEQKEDETFKDCYVRLLKEHPRIAERLKQ